MLKVNNVNNRPFTEDSGRCHRASSPLSIIRSKSKQLSQDIEPIESVSKPRKINFLRRGSSLDKSIINNVLRSKLNHNVCSSNVSYCDHPQNQDLVLAVSTQIPKGLRDVVGT